jgi:choline dehydrogenase-like flavoprotein
MSRADYDVIVVGSGPGAAVTARALGEARLRVLVVEEGDWVLPGAYDQFSLEQMRHQYRNRGLTVALGRPSVAYSEGCGVGGGSEINSGLYHRPSEELLVEWSKRWAVDGLSATDLFPRCRSIEDELLVGARSAPDPPSFQALQGGAERLGWQCDRIPRWVSPETAQAPVDRRTMSNTYWPAALSAGVELLAGVRASRLDMTNGRVVGVRLVDVRTGRARTVHSEHVFVCGGAIQSPALLQRSGLRGSIGRRLALHPTVKVVAEFEHDVNPPHDVPANQVREFAPRFTLGGSASTPALIALALAENWEVFGDAARRWRRCFVYYAAVQGQGRGRVRAIPGFTAPLVSYRLVRDELSLLREGLARLLEVLLQAGARSIYPSFSGAPRVRSADDIELAVRALTRSTSNLMTVHLCGSVPMGEDRIRCGSDSFGKVHGTDNVYVADASMLPAAPGINPQGTIMAIAARNVAHFLAGGSA